MLTINLLPAETTVKDHVSIQMIVDIKSIQPGQPFRLGFNFKSRKNGICTGEIPVTLVCRQG